MLNIQIPESYTQERQYILSVIFNEFLGLDFQVKLSNRANTKISLQHNSDRSLIITDKLFNTPEENWLKPSSLPIQPLKNWDINKTKLNPVIVSPHIPVIYGDNPNNSGFFQQSSQGIYLGIDILGSAFFMLTRYEEIIKPDRDKHDRFPATASLAYQENFLSRPIINEYIEILWSCLILIGLNKSERKNRRFEIFLTHDVDRPFKYKLMDIFSLAKLCSGDIFKRFNIIKALKNLKNWIEVQTISVSIDPYNTFSLIMNISEKYNLKSAFYFICGHSESDPRYHVNDKQIRKLIKQILIRGHEIGLHPSYGTHLQLDKLNTELSTLKKMLEEESISENHLGGRQHYLCWKAPETWQYWNDINLKYDSSVAYAECVGFRCGCCYEYQTFNCITRQALKLKERPLIVMECSLFASEYMNLSCSEARVFINNIIDNCRLFQGTFTMLWHNNQLTNKKNIDFYIKTIQYALFQH